MSSSAAEDRDAVYDPDQDPDQKRQLRRGFRNLAKVTEGIVSWYWFRDGLKLSTDPDSVQNATDLLEKVQQLNSLFAEGAYLSSSS